MVSFAIVAHWNAVPSGEATKVPSLQACEARCTDTCVQFSFNLNSEHCYTSVSTKWGGYELDHVTSGCRSTLVDGCPSGPTPAPIPPPSPPPHFDGVLRPAGDGRLDAYLVPPFPSSHASMVEQTIQGQLHMAWFSGSKEGANEVSIVYSQLNTTSAKAGSAWSPAKVLSRRNDEQDSNQGEQQHDRHPGCPRHACETAADR